MFVHSEFQNNWINLHDILYSSLSYSWEGLDQVRLFQNQHLICVFQLFTALHQA